ncbi:MAG: ATP-dependent RNA helicase DbpA [Granulosicoccus sp.]
MTRQSTPGFSSLSLRPELNSSIEALDFEAMTSVQALSLPPALSGHDVLAQAKTGSGKTAAFAIATLNKLNLSDYQIQALILCPTRELAEQVATQARDLAKHMANTRIITLCGGRPMQPQLNSLKRNPHIVVGTPGRILKHLHKDTLQLDTVQTLVLDEADRMLDMGFHDDIMRILSRIPAKRQTLLFSATYPAQIKHISKTIQQDPVELRVEDNEESTQITQLFYATTSASKTRDLLKILAHHQPESCLIFCNRKLHCQSLADELSKQGVHALALHGDLEQFARDQILLQFVNRSAAVLIATDVAGRGLDVKDLAAVVNYDLTPDPDMYIHRIGRTGRAQAQGLAITLVENGEEFRLDALQQFQSGEPIRLERAGSITSEKTLGFQAPNLTLCINGGKKDKIRPTDILGALTASSEIRGDQIGKINILDKQAYVAVERGIAGKALQILSEGKIKGRRFRSRKLA